MNICTISYRDEARGIGEKYDMPLIIQEFLSNHAYELARMCLRIVIYF